MSKLKAHWDNDLHGRSVLMVEKARGKITVDELTKFLLYDFRIHSHYVVIINANEYCCEGSGWFTEEPKGDMIEVHQIEADIDCPVCTRLSPPQCCPECGEEFKCAHCGHDFKIK